MLEIFISFIPSPETTQDTTPLAWVNISLFDFRSQLRQGEYELYMWSVTEDESIPEDESCFPIGK